MVLRKHALLRIFNPGQDSFAYLPCRTDPKAFEVQKACSINKNRFPILIFQNLIVPQRLIHNFAKTNVWRTTAKLEKCKSTRKVTCLKMTWTGKKYECVVFCILFSKTFWARKLIIKSHWFLYRITCIVSGNSQGFYLAQISCNVWKIWEFSIINYSKQTLIFKEILKCTIAHQNLIFYSQGNFQTNYSCRVIILVSTLTIRYRKEYPFPFLIQILCRKYKNIFFTSYPCCEEYFNSLTA